MKLKKVATRSLVLSDEGPFCFFTVKNVYRNRVEQEEYVRKLSHIESRCWWESGAKSRTEWACELFPEKSRETRNSAVKWIGHRKKKGKIPVSE